MNRRWWGSWSTAVVAVLVATTPASPPVHPVVAAHVLPAQPPSDGGQGDQGANADGGGSAKREEASPGGGGGGTKNEGDPEHADGGNSGKPADEQQPANPQPKPATEPEPAPAATKPTDAPAPAPATKPAEAPAPPAGTKPTEAATPPPGPKPTDAPAPPNVTKPTEPQANSPKPTGAPPASAGSKPTETPAAPPDVKPTEASQAPAAPGPTDRPAARPPGAAPETPLPPAATPTPPAEAPAVDDACAPGTTECVVEPLPTDPRAVAERCGIGVQDCDDSTPPDSWLDRAKSAIKDFDDAASEVVNDLLHLGGSIGQAVLDNPDAMEETLVGAAVATGGGMGVLAGTGISVGSGGAAAAAGIPLAVASGAAAVAGGAAMYDGMSKIMKDAADNYQRREPDGGGLPDHFKNGATPKASELDRHALEQGWTKSQSSTGPVTYTDSNGIKRLIIKKGSPRTPGSEGPHVEMRNSDGERIDSAGNVTGKRQPGNHTPVEYDW